MSQSAAIEAFTAALRDMDKLDALTALETAINAIDAESEADITLELDAAIDARGAAYVAVERAREERPCAYWTPERAPYRAVQMGRLVGGGRERGGEGRGGVGRVKDGG